MNTVNDDHNASILETQEPIMVTKRKRGRPKKVKLPINEISQTSQNNSPKVTDSHNISSTLKTNGKYGLRTRPRQINYKTFRNINVLTSQGVELDNDYD